MADVNSCPALFGQAATQAPQPMHAAASKAASATGFGTRTMLASCAAPGVDGDVAAGLDDAVERAAVDDEVVHDRERSGAERLDVDHVAVVELAHVELARRRAALGAVRLAVDHHPARSADALAAVVLERDRLLALVDEPVVEDVEHLEKRHVGVHVRARRR